MAQMAGLQATMPFVSGSTTADITAKTLSITNPTITNKTYDGNNNISVTLAHYLAFAGSETVTATASGTTSDADAGTGRYVTVAYNLSDGTNGGLASKLRTRKRCGQC